MIFDNASVYFNVHIPLASWNRKKRKVESVVRIQIEKQLAEIARLPDGFAGMGSIA
jgi:hypothetical protein